MEIIKDIKITLYEIFGYLLPGIILLIALDIFYWTFFFRSKPLTLCKLNFGLWILIILISYLLGHMVQALGNIVENIFHINANFFISKRKRDEILDEIIKKVKSEINQFFCLKLEDFEDEETQNKWLFRICDETMFQYGAIENREIYVYRQGFYRGLTISFIILSISLCIRIRASETSIVLYNYAQSISKAEISFFIVLSLFGIIFFFYRYLKFFRIRIRQALLGFLVLQINLISKMKIKEEKKNSNKKSKEIKR